MRIHAKKNYLTLVALKARNQVLITSRVQKMSRNVFDNKFREFHHINQPFNHIFIDLLINTHPKDCKIYQVQKGYELFNTKSFSKVGEFPTLVDCEVAIRLIEGGYF